MLPRVASTWPPASTILMVGGRLGISSDWIGGRWGAPAAAPNADGGNDHPEGAYGAPIGRPADQRADAAGAAAAAALAFGFGLGTGRRLVAAGRRPAAARHGRIGFRLSRRRHVENRLPAFPAFRRSHSLSRKSSPRPRETERGRRLKRSF